MGKTFIEEEILDFPLSSARPFRVNEHKRTELRSMESSDSDNSGLERLFWKENEWNETGFPNKLALKIESHVFSSKPLQRPQEFLQIK